MKKLLAMFLGLCLLFALAACASTQPAAEAPQEAPAAAEPQADAPAAEPEAPAEPAAEAPSETTDAPEEEAIELIVFAAASMTETLQEIQTLYEAAHPNVKLVFNFDSSGTLKTQIESGADCDVFISAGQKQMDQLDINADPEVNTDALDFVLADTRIDLLENKVALCVPDGNPKGVASYDDLAEKLTNGEILMAMGNADVPVGQYTQKIFAFYGLSEEDLAASGVLSYGSNVKEVTTQVAEAAVDCGVIYQTDAFSAGLTVIDTATAEMCGQVIYPAAVLNVTAHEAAAREFLSYLTSAGAGGIFAAVGFTPLG